MLKVSTQSITMTAAVVYGVVERSGSLEIGIASSRYAANGQGGARYCSGVART